jgi:GT2 family glycosyltransferase
MRPLNSKNEMPLVSIIVVSHDRPAYLPRVLDSIVAQSHPNLEIIVVDNASRSSEEIASIISQYKGVKLIQNHANVGFTGGMNTGIEASHGEYVHCTLDDLILERDCIRHLVNQAQEQRSDGLFSGILLMEDGCTIRCAGGEFQLSPIYRQTIFGVGEKDQGQYQRPYRVKYVPGGMIFCSLSLMKRFNGFRTEFFMYSEDTDLCARVAQAGHPITVVPQAKVVILNAPHAFKSEGIAFHKIKNLFSLYLLHARLRVLPEFYLRYGVISLLRALVSDRKIVWPRIQAWGWFLRRSPALVRERYRARLGNRLRYSSTVLETKLSKPSTSIAQ